MNYENAEKFEHDLKGFSRATIIEAKIMLAGFKVAYIENPNDFINILTKMDGKIIIFSEHKTGRTWWYVVFHGLLFYTTLANERMEKR